MITAPRNHERRNPISRPKKTTPSMIASLWMPETRWKSTSGLIASHSAAMGSTPGAPRQVRRRPDHQADADEREHAVQVDPEHDVVARDRGDQPAEGEEPGAVRRGCGAPDRRDAGDQGIVETQRLRGTEDVGVEAARDDLGLREVAVDVGGEQRRRDGERRGPHDEDAGELADGEPHAAGPGEPAEPQPGQHHHAHADVGGGERDRRQPRGEAEHPHAQQRVVGRGRGGAASEGADRHQQRAGEPESPAEPQPASLVGGGGRLESRTAPAGRPPRRVPTAGSPPEAPSGPWPSPRERYRRAR